MSQNYCDYLLQQENPSVWRGNPLAVSNIQHR